MHQVGTIIDIPMHQKIQRALLTQIDFKAA